ncbi:MAG: GAF domain-containing protein [Caldilineaceae bacterium]
MTNHPTTPPPNRTIPESWLPVARVGWLIYALLVLTIHIVGTPHYFELLQSPDSLTIGAWERPTIGDAAALPTLGWTLGGYARYITTWAVLYGIVLYAAGVFVFWRRSHEVVALLVSITLLSQSLGENSIDYLLEQQHPLLRWPVEFNQMTGAVLLLWIGYLFPTGRLVPRWTKWPLIGWGIMNFLWFLFPKIPLNHLYGETAEQHLLATFILITSCYLTGLYAQIYRYRHVSTMEERAQTRWVLLGFAANFINTTVRFLPPALFPILNEPGLTRLIHILVGFPLANIAGMATPIALTIALLRYRLWLIDPILNRAMLYTLLTTTVAGIYGIMLFLMQRVLRLWIALPAEIAIFMATATAALLFMPLYNSQRRIIDRTFQRERLDVQTAFRSLQDEIRTIIALPELLQRLVARISDMLHASQGAIYLASVENQFTLTQSHGTPNTLPNSLAIAAEARQQLERGSAVKVSPSPPHALLIPLTAPQTDAGDPLVGILALGRRSNGQPYTRADLTLLETMGVQAGTAITVARLVAQEQVRAAWRASAAGRAATLAAQLPTAPQALLPQLHELATLAHDDLETAHTLRHLADAFTQQGAPLAASLANGYYFLATGHREPATVIVGLRTLVTELAQTPATVWPEAAALHQPLATLLAGLEAVVWTDILPTCTTTNSGKGSERPSLTSGWGEPLPNELHEPPSDDAVAELHLAQQSLQSAVAGLAAYEQTATVDEQLGLLVQTLDQLNTLIHYLPGALSPPLQTLVQRIAEHWSTLLTRQAAALRRQAQVVASLNTRQIFAPPHDGDEPRATVLLTLVNRGRGEATQLRVTLATAATATIASRDGGFAQQTLARLLPGERRDVALPFVPTESGSQPLHFTIHYNDEEAAEKRVQYRAVVHLLPVGDEFQPIPNPYVAGAPLRPQSSTFVGRHGDLQFIAGALANREGNMALVLTGERRMGKTSLLQQLLVQLDARYVPVYLDCQALAIEPGLGHLLFDLAEAIALAVGLPTPDTADFVERPSAYFERTFLPQVQQRLGERRLLLLFDEFEELEERVDRERLEPEFFPYLRHLIQHSGLATSANLAVLFAGTHQLHELNPDYWSAFFNVAPPPAAALCNPRRHAPDLGAGCAQPALRRPGIGPDAAPHRRPSLFFTVALSCCRQCGKPRNGPMSPLATFTAR